MDLDHLQTLVAAAVREAEDFNGDGAAYADLLAYIAITYGATAEENVFLRNEVKQRVEERDDARSERNQLMEMLLEVLDWATPTDGRHRQQQGGYASELLSMFTRIGDRHRDDRLAAIRRQAMR